MFELHLFQLHYFLLGPAKFIFLIKVNMLHLLKLAKEAVEPNKSLYAIASEGFWRNLYSTVIYEEEKAIRNYATIVKMLDPKCSSGCVS